MLIGIGINIFPPVTSGSGGSAINPGTVANLNLWLDASVGITLNGADVSAWADQSGSGNNATQGVAANQPAFSATGLNGNPTIEFDGVDEFLQCNGPVASFVGEDLPYTFFVVQNAGPSITNGAWLNFGTTVANSSLNDYRFVTQSTPRILHQIADGVGVANIVANENVSANQIYVILNSGTSGSIYRQNTLLSGPTAMNRGAITPTNGWIGAIKPGVVGQVYWTGKISEIILYTRALSQSEREGIVAYLKGKYGL